MKSTPQGFTLDEALEILASTIETVLRVHPIRLRVDIAEDPEAPITLRLREFSVPNGRVRIERQTEDDSGMVAANNRMIEGKALPPEPSTNHAPDDIWRPNDNQQLIIDALQFRALRTDELIHESGVCRGKLYQRPGGIHELREQGVIRLHPKLGYYSPDAPPPELVNGDENEMPEKKSRFKGMN